MKKIILTIIVLIAGIIGCSKSSENKSFEKKIDDKQTASNISENNVQNRNSNKNYEISLKLHSSRCSWHRKNLSY